MKENNIFGQNDFLPAMKGFQASWTLRFPSQTDSYEHSIRTQTTLKSPRTLKEILWNPFVSHRSWSTANCRELLWQNSHKTTLALHTVKLYGKKTIKYLHITQKGCKWTSKTPIFFSSSALVEIRFEKLQVQQFPVVAICVYMFGHRNNSFAF